MLGIITQNKNKAEANQQLEGLVKKQEADMNEKLDKLEESVEREFQKMQLSTDELKELMFVDGNKTMDRLWNIFVKLKAMFLHVRDTIRLKFTVKTQQRKDQESEEQANKSQNGDNVEKDDKEKKEKNKKDNSDEMLSKRWEELKTKLE